MRTAIEISRIVLEVLLVANAVLAYRTMKFLSRRQSNMLDIISRHTWRIQMLEDAARGTMQKRGSV